MLTVLLQIVVRNAETFGRGKLVKELLQNGQLFSCHRVFIAADFSNKQVFLVDLQLGLVDWALKQSLVYEVEQSKNVLLNKTMDGHTV